MRVRYGDARAASGEPFCCEPPRLATPSIDSIAFTHCCGVGGIEESSPLQAAEWQNAGERGDGCGSTTPAAAAFARVDVRKGDSYPGGGPPGFGECKRWWRGMGRRWSPKTAALLPLPLLCIEAEACVVSSRDG